MFLLKEFTLKPLKYMITNQLYTVTQCYRISVIYLLPNLKLRNCMDCQFYKTPIPF